MNFGSVCSGIEAASVAWHPLGWHAKFLSEIDRFPSSVLEFHYPDVPNLGDMTRYQEWPDAAIDVLVGGTPCQSFSVAGLRKGLADPRGNLMLTYGAIAQRYRPRWLVWENVPGVLSSDGGRDFGTFLGMLGELGYGFAYRVLDAQYFGVAQRRRRVFVVGCLGDWRRAAAVLFERASLRGDPAPRRESRQTAPTIPSRSTAGGGLGTDFDCDGGLIPHTVGALTDGAHNGGGLTGRTPTPAASLPSVAMCLNAGAMCRQDSESETLIPTIGGGFDVAPIAFGWQNSASQGDSVSEHIAPSLDKSKTPAIAFAQNQRDEVRTMDVAGALAAEPGAKQQTYIFNGASHGQTFETDAGALLRRVREEVGAEAFSEWGLGILASLQPQEILRSGLHGIELRPAPFTRSWVVCCALGSPISSSEGAMQSLREAIGERCPSQGRQPSEQLAGELGAYLSGLSQPGAQAERLLRDLWLAGEGLGLLRQALSAVQEARQPTRRSEQHGSSQVRRLTVEECEFLQGFPRGYTATPKAKDGPRYKALGNSMAVPVLRWIGERIAQVQEIAA